MRGQVLFSGALLPTIADTMYARDLESGDILFSASTGKAIKVKRVQKMDEEVLKIVIKVPRSATFSKIPFIDSVCPCKTYSFYTSPSGQIFIKIGNSVGVASIHKLRNLFTKCKRVFVPVSYSPTYINCSMDEIELLKPQFWCEVVGIVSLIDVSGSGRHVGTKGALSHQTVSFELDECHVGECVVLPLQEEDLGDAMFLQKSCDEAMYEHQLLQACRCGVERPPENITLPVAMRHMQEIVKNCRHVDLWYGFENVPYVHCLSGSGWHDDDGYLHTTQDDTQTTETFVQKGVLW